MTPERRAAWGVTLAGTAIGVSAFMVFQWFFIAPRGTFSIANPIAWFVMVPFVVASVLLTQVVRGNRLAKRRAAADALKDALIASVSHDLRTPLTTIKALAHDMRALGDERSQVIEEQADRLNRYVADLLDLSRLNAGEMPLHVELNAVDDLLSAVIQETEARMGGRALTVPIEPAGELLAGRFDLALSVRVLANLIENADKYSPPGAPLEVVARASARTIDIAVLDRGHGIQLAEAKLIFEPFYRPQGAPADSGSAGLGLAVARRMAELQQGSLRYAPRDGGGSAFTLSLPAAGLDDSAGAERVARDFVKS